MGSGFLTISLCVFVHETTALADPSRFVIPDNGYSFYGCSPANQGWKPLVDGQFQIIGCVPSVPATSGASGSVAVTISSGSCEAQAEETKINFIKQMKKIRETVPTACKEEDCSDIASKLKFNCTSSRRRRKRAATGTLSYTLPGGGDTTSGMCSTIRKNGGLGSDFPTSSCPTTTPTCAHGYILNDARTSCCEFFFSSRALL